MRWIAALLVSTLSGQVLAEGQPGVNLSYARSPNCVAITKQNKLNPFAYLFREYCEQIIATSKQGNTHRRGQPQPSRRVLVVPAHRSDEAKRLGVACMGGLVLLRIENGWKQALDADHRFYTCTEK